MLFPEAFQFDLLSGGESGQRAARGIFAAAGFADAEDGERAVIVLIDDPGDLPAQHGALPGFEPAHGRLLSSNSVRPSASNRRMNSSGWAFAQSSSMRGSGAGKVRRSTSRKSAPAVRRRSSQVS